MSQTKISTFILIKSAKFCLKHSSAHALWKIGKCTLCQVSKKNVPLIEVEGTSPAAPPLLQIRTVLLNTEDIS